MAGVLGTSWCIREPIESKHKKTGSGCPSREARDILNGKEGVTKYQVQVQITIKDRGMTISLGREGSYTIVEKKIAYDLHWAVYYA